MEFSQEIIDVLDYLCNKFGIVIDWTSDNVVPYIESLCEKFIKYEMFTSVAWIIIILVITGIIAIALSVAHKMASSVDWDICRYEGRCVVAGVLWFTFILMSLISILVVCTQVFDIIECCTFPEKTILEYLKNLMNSVK
jgi:hypothetical protein